MNATDKMNLHNLRTQYGLGLDLTPWEIAQMLRLQAEEHQENETLPSSKTSDILFRDVPSDRAFARECESLQEWQKTDTNVR
jgi:hypothetical protein